MSAPISSFNINISDDAILLLKRKIELTTLPDELEEAKWDYGTPLPHMKRLVDYWKDQYDWHRHERELNVELPQFTRDIEVDGFGALNIHFVHKRSSVETAIPLLFVHGWPGSFIEVRKILPLLTSVSPDQPSFHVVALSLPGFGFSEAPKKKGFKVPQYAEVGNKLMLSLGYNEYVTQGGDWGHTITREIARTYGEKHSKAWHTNMPLSKPPHPLKNPVEFLRFLITPYTEQEKAELKQTMQNRKTGFGYFFIQNTKPQTLGYGLADSPVGLLAWIYEKLIAWTDNYPWTDDEVLTWISIHWFSRAGPAASLRIYGEFDFEENAPPTIPMGVSYFPREITKLPHRWTLREGNVVFAKDKEKGGHFAAYEVPDALVSDLRTMFGRGGPAFGAVKHNTGY